MIIQQNTRIRSLYQNYYLIYLRLSNILSAQCPFLRNYFQHFIILESTLLIINFQYLSVSIIYFYRHKMSSLRPSYYVPSKTINTPGVRIKNEEILYPLSKQDMKSSKVESCLSEEVEPPNQQSMIGETTLMNQIYNLKSVINDLCIQNKIQNINLIEEKKKTTQIISQNRYLEEQLRKVNILHQESDRQLEVLRKKLKTEIESERRSEEDNCLEGKRLILQQAQEQIYNLQLENENLNQVNKTLATTIQQQKNIQISNILLKNQQLVSHLKDQLRRSQYNLQQVRNQVKLYRTRNDQLQQKLQNYRRQLATIEDRKEIRQQSQDKSRNFQNQILRIKQESDLKTMKIQELNFQTNRLSNLLKALEQRVVLKDSELQQQSQLNNQLYRRIQVYEKQYKQLQQLYFKQERQFTNLTLNNDHFSNKHEMTIRSLRSELQMVKQQYNLQMKQKQQLISKLSNKLNILQYSSDGESSKRKLQLMGKEIELIENENKSLKVINKSLQNEVKELKAEFDAEMVKWKNEKKCLDDEIKKIKIAFEGKCSQQMRIIKNLNKNEQEYEELKQKLRELETEKDLVYYNFIQLEDKNKKITEKLTKADQQTSKLIQQNQTLVNRSCELENKVTIIDNLYNRLEAKYKTDILQMDHKITNVMNESRKSKNKTSRCLSQNAQSIAHSHHIVNSIVYNQANDFQENDTEQREQRTHLQKSSKQHSNLIEGFGFNFGRKRHNQQEEEELFLRNYKVKSAIQSGECKNRNSKKNKVLCENDRLKNVMGRVQTSKHSYTARNDTISKSKFDKEKENLGRYYMEISGLPQDSVLYSTKGQREEDGQNQTLNAVPTITDLQSASFIKDQQQRAYQFDKQYSTLEREEKRQIKKPFLPQHYIKVSDNQIQFDPSETLDQKIKKIRTINNKLRNLHDDHHSSATREREKTIQSHPMSPLTHFSMITRKVHIPDFY